MMFRHYTLAWKHTTNGDETDEHMLINMKGKNCSTEWKKTTGDCRGEEVTNTFRVPALLGLLVLVSPH